MEHEKWLEERRKGIGGSDAAKVLGYSRWGGPFSVYQDKVNGIRDDVSDLEAVHFGTVLEEVVAREFAERAGLKVHRLNRIVTSPEHPFMLANIDRKISGQNVGLECKTANARKAEEWKDDELPTEYYVQMQHYCAVMGWEGCWVACLIGGQRFVYKFVPRNDEFIAGMVAGEREFWEGHVIPRIPPAPGAFDTVSVPQTAEEMLTPTDEDMDIARELAELKNILDTVEARKDALENQLKARIGSAAGIEGVATFRQSRGRAKTDWEGVCRELNPGPELIQKYTATVEGPRRFLFKFKKEAV